jgi:hypothetical protein
MSSHRTKNTPWGIIAGILMASFAVLAGVIQSVDPITILQRAAVSAVIVGGMTGALAALLRITPARYR